jgi:hypothetical protein
MATTRYANWSQFTRLPIAIVPAAIPSNTLRHIFRNGQRFDIGLCDGAKLEENTWHEDGDAETGLCFGHRDRKETTNDKFDQPNREWGCHYHGKDEPKVRGKPGDMIDVDLKFKGQTYDNCQDKFGQIHEWAFTYKGPLGGL